MQFLLKKPSSYISAQTMASYVGAADEARTRYLHLGKVALYQMSYGRIRGAFILAPSRSYLKRGPAKACECKILWGRGEISVLVTAVLLARPPDKRLTFRHGASDRNRTNDTGIFSPLLYRLSYRGIESAFIPALPRIHLLNRGSPQNLRTQGFVGKRRNFSACHCNLACKIARQAAEIPTKRPGSGSNRRPPA